MLKGSCHCGAVKIEISQLPREATRCNCSVCRRYAATWAYFTEQTVEVSYGSTPAEAYCWGDQLIDFLHCTQCGCITHYKSTAKAKSDRVAVNLNMFPEEAVAEVTVRHFDGAETWKYLD